MQAFDEKADEDEDSSEANEQSFNGQGRVSRLPVYPLIAPEAKFKIVIDLDV